MKLGQEKLEESLDIIHLIKMLRKLSHLNKKKLENDELEFIDDATIELSDT
jgi:hypothetical protein